MPAADYSAAQQPAIEMTADPLFARRIIRLAITSVLALGYIWWLSATTLDSHPAIGGMLVVGWLLMPSILVLSLRWPGLRYALIGPSSLVGLALLVICAGALPGDQWAGVGWLLITSGVLFGGALGVWFWFRWIPVPGRVLDPFSPGRWVLIAIHVSLIIAGLVLVSISTLT